MTTLQDRVEAYAKYAAASAANAAHTTIGTVEGAGAEDVPSTVIYEARKHDFAYASAAGLIAALVKASLEPQGEAWAFATLRGDIVSQRIAISDRPFDRLDELLDDEEKVRELVRHIRRSLPAPFARKLAKRLEGLVEIAKEEAPEQSEMSPESLRMFIRFLHVAPDFTYPDVMLTPSGNIWAQWRAAPNKHFSTEFYPDGEVRFVIFAPDVKRRDQTIRLSGIASVDTLLNAAEPHGVREWATR